MVFIAHTFHQEKNNSLAVQVCHKHLPSTLCNQQSLISVHRIIPKVNFVLQSVCVNNLNPKRTQTKILCLQGCISNRLKKKGSIENKERNCHASKFCHDITRNWLFLTCSGFSHSYNGIIVFPPVLPTNASAGNQQLQHV